MLLATAAVAILGGCSSSNNNQNPNTPTPPPAAGDFRVQLLHASPDAPAVNITGIGAPIEGVDYKVGSGAITATAGTTRVTVEGIIPGGTTPVIGPVDLTFAEDTLYSASTSSRLMRTATFST